MAKELENIEEQINWHWRNSMRPVRFFNFDARAATPFCILFVYTRPVTLFLTVITLVFFRILEHRGLTVPAAMRSFRQWITGKNRPGWISVRKKAFIDHG